MAGILATRRTAAVYVRSAHIHQGWPNGRTASESLRLFVVTSLSNTLDPRCLASAQQVNTMYVCMYIHT
jgi:hypothetical protein